MAGRSMAPSLSPERWQLLNSLLEQALSIEPERRTAFVDHACGDDRDLHRELIGLLEAAQNPSDFISPTLQDAARAACGPDVSIALAPGVSFSHYTVISLIGTGGMGRVYLAEDTRLKRKVALKTLTPEYVSDPDALLRFEQEARASSALNHPNIVTIYDIGQFEGIHFMACEFIEGVTIRDRLRAGPFTPRAAIDIAAQVAAGLSAAHALGIAHRDIKPENILVRHDGLVKIVDFGIAKLTEISRTARDMTTLKSPGALQWPVCTTGPGMVVGTLRYMSPEQARGLAIDGRSDLFSLGTVLYEMVAGQAPFRGDTGSDVIAEILKTDPPALHQVAPAAPPRLSAIVARAASKDRAARYATASELASDLKQLENELTNPAPVRPPPPWWAAFKSVPFAVLLIAFFALGGLLLWRSRSRQPAQVQPPSLAILPFRNLKPDPATDFLGFSLADAAITKFAGVGSLVVRPSSSVDRYRNQVIDPEKVSADLRVNMLLTGTYIKEGDDLRITTQLVSVKPTTVLWQRTIDLKYEKLLTVQDALAQEIISGLELHLTPAETARVRYDNTIDGAAYEDYLRGVDLYATNEFRSAIEMLERSAARAPAYARTWAHLGRAYTTNASLAFGGREQYIKAESAYRKALRLNPGLIEARVYMANLFTDTGRVEQALPLIKEALAANPNYAEAHWELGYAYRFAGLLPESIEECERARQLDPQVKLHSSALNSYLYVGEYEKFLASLPPDETAYILFYRGFAHLYLHHSPDAGQHFAHAYQVDPSLLQAGIGQAFLLALTGRTSEGLRLMHQTEAKVRERGVTDGEGIYKIAQAYASLGDTASALRILQYTVERGFFCYQYFQTDPLIARVRREAAFSRLIAQCRARHDRFQAALTAGQS